MTVQPVNSATDEVCRMAGGDENGVPAQLALSVDAPIFHQSNQAIELVGHMDATGARSQAAIQASKPERQPFSCGSQQEDYEKHA